MTLTLKTIIASKSLNQEAIAARASVSQSYVSRVLRGGRTSPEVKARVAAAIGLRPEDLDALVRRDA